ncbi:MAG: carboxypeptidase regulatory-like domain-containing protein [Terriglobia bacterium]
MKKQALLLMALAVCAFTLLPVKKSRADNLYGTIRGLVKDQSGAVIPGATVKVTNTGTGISREVTSLGDGSFEVLNLLVPATYNVTVEKNGFKKYTGAGIHLNVNQVYVVNAALQVGAATQQVTVQANAAQIDTTSMQLGASITGSQIVNLPLNGRNWTQLQQLQPGVVSSSDRFGSGTMGTDFSTNGAETQQNMFLINGIDSTDISMNNLNIIPSPDAIAEFRMVTSTINPEYGRNSGAIVNAIIRSGTNQIHGDGFDFYRETNLDARTFFQSTVSPFHQNQFGGTVGGPVLLPHIYDGRNKTFFFFSYQGTRNIVPQAFSVPTVYSPSQRTGLFPDLATSGGSSGFSMVGENGATYPAGTPYSTLFPTGQIPQADLNPLAVKLMNQFVPSPNAPNNGYTFNPSIAGLEDQTIWRIDENIRQQDSIFAYGFWERHPTTSSLPFFGSTLPGFAELDGDHAQEYQLSWNHIFSPTTVNEARFGYYRYNYNNVVPANPLNPTSYGFTGINPQSTTDASIPVITVTGLFTLGFSPYGPQPYITQTYQAEDNFSKIAGRHTLKFGFSMERFEEFNPYHARLSGVYSYNGGGTFSTGDAGADFLLGLPDSFLQQSGAINNGRSREYYSYGQDQYQVRPNFTLTYGLGWDIETPYLNLYAGGEAVNEFRPGQQSTVFPTAPVGLVFPGDAGINSAGGLKTHLRDFAPRIGFAWSPDSSRNWSVHAGFGIYYNRTEEELALQNLTAPPFSQTSAGVGDIGGSPNFAAPFTGWCSGAAGAPPVACSEPNKFPFTPPAPGAMVDFSNFEPFSLNVQSPNLGSPMSENYNLTVERQLNDSTTLSLAYVGNVGRHLEGAYELNPAGQFPGVNPSAVSLGCNAFNLGSCDPGSFRYDPSVFGSIGQQSTEFNSNYNSLQLELDKHLTKGLQFTLAYTYSRYFDYTSNLENNSFNSPGINPFDWHSMYAPSANDAPNRLVMNYYYTLPIYHFIPHLRQLTDGWSLTGITTFQSGFPIGVYDSSYSSLTCNVSFTFYACPDRPNVAGAPLNLGNSRNYSLNGASNYLFNPSAFAIANGSIGNAIRNPVRGPGLNDWDMSLIKDIHFTESKYIELRLDTFNLFNHTQFLGTSTGNGGGVVSDVNDPRFGRVIAAHGARILQLAGKIYF